MSRNPIIKVCRSELFKFQPSNTKAELFFTLSNFTLFIIVGIREVIFFYVLNCDYTTHLIYS